MVAKGHDFADVTLGVVLDADATLRFPDFRAEERTFALISQLAGRVGRGGEGTVLVQTIAPEARAIRDAAQHDSEGFRSAELARRRELCLPAIRPPDPRRLRGARRPSRRATRPARSPRCSREHGVGALGPAPLFRLRGRERRCCSSRAPTARPTRRPWATP